MNKYRHTLGLGISGLLAAVTPFALQVFGVIVMKGRGDDEGLLLISGLFFGLFIAVYAWTFGLVGAGGIQDFCASCCGQSLCQQLMSR